MKGSVNETAFHDIYFSNKENVHTGTILHEDNESGTGEMQCFEVAPGIQISYNNLNMDSCFRPVRFQKDFLQIDHCLEGCYECELEGGGVSFLGEGDLCVNNLCQDKQVFVSSRIPLKKYRGITILLELETSQKTLDTGFQQANINLKQIRDNLCADGQSLLIKSKYQIDHIFSELYCVDERIRLSYFWIKIIELLLFLSLLDNSSVRRPQQFSEEISQRTQEVYQYIIENPFAKLTIPELAVKYGVSESSMKRCFKSISGKSIGTFVKIKKMDVAAEMLISEQNLSIGEVAYAAGYENQSKFSAAFKSIMGVTPQAYRYKYG